MAIIYFRLPFTSFNDQTLTYDQLGCGLEFDGGLESTSFEYQNLGKGAEFPELFGNGGPGCGRPAVGPASIVPNQSALSPIATQMNIRDDKRIFKS